ncbi:four helix bundle protein [Sinomicrobium weinanense]|uniref:Four helix bundle protein n=1 Tax=Sinomicrobium weinanense TaxID=2842200 RepID=A0A926Q1P7_9FLAO|nr:four helix bundle protein [Sinomicrobium weinanense]MBU3124699.1 four helix bundle protein [Sinomicrobium weinanense]
MESSNWTKYKIEIRERLKKFALNILDLSGKISLTPRGKAINYQVVKSGTSMYVNYRATLRSRSKKEFYCKLSIVVEGTDETEAWLGLLMASGILKEEFITELHKECEEHLKILGSMRKRLS